MPHRSGPLGGLWRSLLGREQAVYERLGGIAGIPRSFGLVGAGGSALEYVAGPSLRDHEARIADRDGFFAKLFATLKAMHAAGVAHGDSSARTTSSSAPASSRIWSTSDCRAAQRDELAVESCVFERL